MERNEDLKDDHLKEKEENNNKQNRALENESEKGEIKDLEKEEIAEGKEELKAAEDSDRNTEKASEIEVKEEEEKEEKKKKKIFFPLLLSLFLLIVFSLSIYFYFAKEGNKRVGVKNRGKLTFSSLLQINEFRKFKKLLVSFLKENHLSKEQSQLLIGKLEKESWLQNYREEIAELAECYLEKRQGGCIWAYLVFRQLGIDIFKYRFNLKKPFFRKVYYGELEESFKKDDFSKAKTILTLLEKEGVLSEKDLLPITKKLFLERTSFLWREKVVDVLDGYFEEENIKKELIKEELENVTQFQFTSSFYEKIKGFEQDFWETLFPLLRPLLKPEEFFAVLKEELKKSSLSQLPFFFDYLKRYPQVLKDDYQNFKFLYQKAGNNDRWIKLLASLPQFYLKSYFEVNLKELKEGFKNLTYDKAKRIIADFKRKVVNVLPVSQRKKEFQQWVDFLCHEINFAKLKNWKVIFKFLTNLDKLWKNEFSFWKEECLQKKIFQFDDLDDEQAFSKWIKIFDYHLDLQSELKKIFKDNLIFSYQTLLAHSRLKLCKMILKELKDNYYGNYVKDFSAQLDLRYKKIFKEKKKLLEKWLFSLKADDYQKIKSLLPLSVRKKIEAGPIIEIEKIIGISATKFSVSLNGKEVIVPLKDKLLLKKGDELSLKGLGEEKKVNFKKLWEKSLFYLKKDGRVPLVKLGSKKIYLLLGKESVDLFNKLKQILLKDE